MEIAGLLLLVLLPPEDATGETALGIKASLRQEFGEVAMAVAPDTLVTPAMWRGEKSPMRARFVAHLTWEEKHRARLELLAVSRGAGATETRRSRWLTFAPQDGDSERGRAIGLVVAEMMREWPSSVWTDAPASDKKPKPPVPVPTPPQRFELGALFLSERVAGGNWAIGPRATYGYRIDEQFLLEVSGTTLFASDFNYLQVGFGVGGSYRFLSWEGGRHAVRVGLSADVLRESASATVSGGSHVTGGGWYSAAGADVTAHITIGHNLRLAGQLGWRVVSSAMTIPSGTSSGPSSTSFSRWRPSLGLGLELVF